MSGKTGRKRQAFGTDARILARFAVSFRHRPLYGRLFNTRMILLNNWPGVHILGGNLQCNTTPQHEQMLQKLITAVCHKVARMKLPGGETK